MEDQLVKLNLRRNKIKFYNKGKKANIILFSVFSWCESYKTMTLGFFSNDNSLNFKLYQMDVKSAFLNRVLRDDVCIKQAEGFEDPSIHTIFID